MVAAMQALPVFDTTGRHLMETPEDVAQMLRLKAAGLSIKHIARKMGCSRNTVRRYLRADGWVAYKRPVRESVLRGLESWLGERLQRHRGNADVVRQDLEREHGIVVSLRTVERAVEPLRRELRAADVATVRFETAPGEQLQIDFGEVTVPIAGERVKVHLFVATLGYSRRPYVAVFEHERQAAWFGGMEGAFHHFGGRPRELLLDNARPLVSLHDARTREVRFNDRFHAFCRYWDLVPKACAPYRARTKGKDERGVGYVKRNAIAGHSFASSRRWKRTWRGGCGKWPMCASTAPPARFRSCGSRRRKRRRCGRSKAVPASSRFANASDACIPMRASRSAVSGFKRHLRSRLRIRPAAVGATPMMRPTAASHWAAGAVLCRRRRAGVRGESTPGAARLGADASRLPGQRAARALAR
jgi:transposase